MKLPLQDDHVPELTDPLADNLGTKNQDNKEDNYFMIIQNHLLQGLETPSGYQRDYKSD